jgi:chromosome segregation ATPase
MNPSRQTDFIDSDLSAPKIPRPDYQAEDVADRAELGNLQNQRKRLEEEVSGTARELESLRQQQENLLKRKQTLESLREQQGQYAEEKQDLTRRVHQCLVLLDKEEVRVSQLQELYATSRDLFSRLEDQLKNLGEGGWEESVFQDELTRSTDSLKAVRMQFKKGLARLDVLDWNSDSSDDEFLSEDLSMNYSFGFWLKAGIGIGLPLALLCGLVALLVVWILTNSGLRP